MKLLDVIKRAILEGKLDTELGITDCDVMQRFDKVMELIDKPIQLPNFNSKDLVTSPTYIDWSKANVNSDPKVLTVEIEPGVQHNVHLWN